MRRLNMPDGSCGDGVPLSRPLTTSDSAAGFQRPIGIIGSPWAAMVRTVYSSSLNCILFLPLATCTAHHRLAQLALVVHVSLGNPDSNVPRRQSVAPEAEFPSFPHFWLAVALDRLSVSLTVFSSGG